jgi:3-deoxy-7-phosphoheptulonate synthase
MKKNDPLYIFGPCAMESLEQMTSVTDLLKRHQLPYLRAQLFKPRTNPDSFQGIGEQGLAIFEALKQQYPGVRLVAEAGSVEQLKLLAPHVAAIQVGARNMQNFELLKRIGQYFSEQHDFVLLKRGFANTVSEWLEAARYVIQSGVPKEKLILCERGSRSLTSPTGVHLDLLAALEAKRHGFRVIVDPSHGTKRAEFVIPMAKAALQLELDGLMMECHPCPEKSVSDAAQALSLEELEAFIKSSLK